MIIHIFNISGWGLYYLNFVSDAYRRYVGVLSFLGLVPGVLLLFWYCFRIGFYPVGIGVGDFLFFIFVTIVFGASYLILLMMVMQSSFSLLVLYGKFLKFLRRRGFDLRLSARSRLVGRWSWFMAVSGILNLFLFLLYAIISGDYLGAFGLIFVESILVWIYVGSRRGYLVVLFLILPLLFLHGSIGILVDNAFKVIGFRNESVSVAVDPMVSGVGELIGGNEYYCGKVCVLKNVDIEFTGVGKFTKMRVNGDGKSISVVLPTESIVYIVIPN